jgi:hypothetical protein
MFKYGALGRIFNMAQVRGPPASGKSTLARLLHVHILNKEPNAVVVRIEAWETEGGGWRAWLKPGSVLIVDRAQTSYQDDDFWGQIKLIGENHEYRVITFASYGSYWSERRFVNQHSPSQVQVVGLQAKDYGDGIAIGLLLTKVELHEFVDKRFPSHRFDDMFLSCIHGLTAGHVGACYDILEAIQADHVS